MKNEINKTQKWCKMNFTALIFFSYKDKIVKKVFYTEMACSLYVNNTPPPSLLSPRVCHSCVPA